MEEYLTALNDPAPTRAEGLVEEIGRSLRSWSKDTRTVWLAPLEFALGNAVFDLAKHMLDKPPGEVSANEALGVKRNLDSLWDLISAGMCRDVKPDKLQQHMRDIDALVGECTALESMQAVVELVEEITDKVTKATLTTEGAEDFAMRLGSLCEVTLSEGLLTVRTGVATVARQVLDQFATVADGAKSDEAEPTTPPSSHAGHVTVESLVDLLKRMVAMIPHGDGSHSAVHMLDLAIALNRELSAITVEMSSAGSKHAAKVKEHVARVSSILTAFRKLPALTEFQDLAITHLGATSEKATGVHGIVDGLLQAGENTAEKFAKAITLKMEQNMTRARDELSNIAGGMTDGTSWKDGCMDMGREQWDVVEKAIQTKLFVADTKALEDLCTKLVRATGAYTKAAKEGGKSKEAIAAAVLPATNLLDMARATSIEVDLVIAVVVRSAGRPLSDDWFCGALMPPSHMCTSGRTGHCC